MRMIFYSVTKWLNVEWMVNLSMFYSIKINDLMLSPSGTSWGDLIVSTEEYPEGNLLCMDTTYEGCKTRGELYMKKMIPIFTELCGGEYPVDNLIPVPFTKFSCKVK